jgi:hypothetical protein
MRRYGVLLSLLLGLRPRAHHPSACVRLGDEDMNTDMRTTTAAAPDENMDIDSRTLTPAASSTASTQRRVVRDHGPHVSVCAILWPRATRGAGLALHAGVSR